MLAFQARGLSEIGLGRHCVLVLLVCLEILLSDIVN